MQKNSEQLGVLHQGSDGLRRPLNARIPVDLYQYLVELSQRDGVDLTRTLITIIQMHRIGRESPRVLDGLHALGKRLDSLEFVINDVLAPAARQACDTALETRRDALEASNEVVRSLNGLLLAIQSGAQSGADEDASRGAGGQAAHEQAQDGGGGDDLEIISMQRPSPR